MSDIFVVEGRHDAARLKQVHPHLDVVVTEGSAVPEATLQLLEKLSVAHTIVLMLDPDHPGETIRKTLQARIPSARHVFLRKADCIEKHGRKVGIEHASVAVLEVALKQHIQSQATQPGALTMQDLVGLGLSGSPDAAKRRARLTDTLAIGHCNAKTLLKRLNWLGFDKAHVAQVLS